MSRKMKFSGIMLSMLLMSVLNICLAQKKEYDPTKQYTVEQLKEDLLYTKENLEKYHPGLYWYTDKSSFDRLYDSLLQEIDHPMTTAEFFPIIQSVFAKVSEKHALVTFSEEARSYMSNEKKFPFKVKYINGAMYIHQNASMDSSLVKGTKIVSINGRTTDDILAEMLPKLISDGFNETAKYRMDIDPSFKLYYKLLIDQKEDFKLIVKKPGENQEKEVAVSGINNMEFAKRVAAQYNAPKEETFQLEILADKATAVLTNNDFNGTNTDEKNNNKFNEYAFESLKNKPEVQNLIIDVRKNDGGSPTGLYNLISYLADEGIQLYKKIERNDKALFFKKDGKGKYDAPKYIRTWRPKHMENRFTGNVYILTSGYTYSLAGLFTAMMSHHTNAVMVGEETGGGFYGATAGKQKLVSLKNTQLRVGIPVMRFLTNVSGQPEGRGTLPDYEVTQTYEDFLKNTDTEMEFTLDLIKRARIEN
jgi:hypothetical protein